MLSHFHIEIYLSRTKELMNGYDKTQETYITKVQEE